MLAWPGGKDEQSAAVRRFLDYLRSCRNRRAWIGDPDVAPLAHDHAPGLVAGTSRKKSCLALERRHRAATSIAGEPGRLILERCAAVRIGHRRWFNVLVSLFGGRLWPGKAQSTSASSTAEDDAIITALYQQYRGPLMTFVMRLTAGNRQQAEDVVQETMVRAWREAGRLDLSEPSLMPWLTTVARRIVIDDHRRKQARPIETADTELANLPAEDDTAAADRRLIVAEALLALSPLHRQVLNETILRDRTVNQAAEVLGIPVGTVKSRVYYALRALQVVLAERGVLP